MLHPEALKHGLAAIVHVHRARDYQGSLRVEQPIALVLGYFQVVSHLRELPGCHVKDRTGVDGLVHLIAPFSFSMREFTSAQANCGRR
jgi:hypothetical protein